MAQGRKEGRAYAVLEIVGLLELVARFSGDRGSADAGADRPAGASSTVMKSVKEETRRMRVILAIRLSLSAGSWNRI